jgi:hypothetical protein
MVNWTSMFQPTATSVAPTLPSKRARHVAPLIALLLLGASCDVLFPYAPGLTHDGRGDLAATDDGPAGPDLGDALPIPARDLSARDREVDVALLSTVLPPVADAYVASRSSDIAFGATSELRIGNCTDPPNGAMRSWLRFDLRSLPAGAAITSAELAIYFDRSWNTQPYELHRSADDGWAEATISWITQPAVDAAVAATIPGFQTKGWQRWDVSALTAAEAVTDGLLSVMIKGAQETLFPSADHENWGRSREHWDDGTRPRLTVGCHLP